MKITQNIDLKVNKFILVVSGNHVGRFYLGTKNKLVELPGLEIKNPKYSDKEGFFLRAGLGRVFGSGSVREPKNKQAIDKYLRELKEKISKLDTEHKPEKIFLTGPKYLHNELETILEGSDIMFVEGNFTKEHPFKILERIQNKKYKNVGLKVPLKEAARKILTKTIKR